jgi:FHA domain/von Willebrand factor type A domain
MLTEHMDIECRQPEPLALQCDYRILSGADLVSAAAGYAGIIVEGEQTVDPLTADGTTAIMFLVDTSDPGRRAVVARNREHIARMVESGGPRDVYGLAAFDSELEMLCEPGCTGADVTSSTERLFAKGRTTELYRNLLETIKRLSAFDAERRQIVLMSDGLAEDLAYHHEDVVKAARKARIVISTVGYPRSVAQSVALQNLRRLSEETGGLFVAASATDYDIPASFFGRVISVIDGGGRLEFDLGNFQRNDATGDIELSLAFQTTERSFLVPATVVVPDAKLDVATDAVDSSVVRAPSAARHLATPTVPSVRPVSAWFWYGLPAIVFSAILASAIGYALAVRRRRDGHPDPTKHAIPHAFLVLADNEKMRYKVDHTPWRIGRGRNNDLTLDDSSVSRLHAEIRRDALGQFTVQDLDSLNGVFVNDEAVTMTHLDEKDRVDIGEVGFIFTMHDEDYARQDATILIRTRTPS